MQTYFGKPTRTCIILEEALGLKRGDIKQIRTYPDGSIEIETSITLNSKAKTKIEAITKLKEMPKPDMFEGGI